MTKAIVILGAALLGAACIPAVAQTAPAAKAVEMVASAPGTATLTNAAVITARVEAIDKASRQVTLKGPKGNLKTVTAGPEVRNFDQIAVGDMLVVRLIESLTLTLKKDGKELVSRTERRTAHAPRPVRSPAGSSAGRSRSRPT
jgi:hypothetical protein